MNSKHYDASGEANGAGMCIAIVQARFNRAITDLLVDGATHGLREHGVEAHNIVTFRVPGSFELALAAQRAARTRAFDAIICIGAIIRGDTAHFQLVAAETATGIAAVSRHEDTPVMFCVLTTNTIEQARERSGAGEGNSGWQAALGAIEMAHLLKQIDRATPR